MLLYVLHLILRSVFLIGALFLSSNNAANLDPSWFQPFFPPFLYLATPSPARLPHSSPPADQLSLIASLFLVSLIPPTVLQLEAGIQTCWLLCSIFSLSFFFCLSCFLLLRRFISLAFIRFVRVSIYSAFSLLFIRGFLCLFLMSNSLFIFLFVYGLYYADHGSLFS